MEMATGYYLNLFDGSYDGRDIFVLFNEPNPEPTKEELSTLSRLIEAKLQENPSRKTLEAAIENSGLSCVAFGVQVLTRGLK